MKEIKDIILSYDDVVIPLEKQKIICSYLDSLNKLNNYLLIFPPSSLYNGALHLISNKGKNPDFLAQAAHSLREIIYHYTSESDKRKEVIKKLIQRFKLDGNEQEIEAISSILNKLYFLFTQIAHHFNDTTKHDDFIKGMIDLKITIGDVRKFNLDHFKKMIVILTNAWYESLPRQVSIHKLIDDLFACNQAFIDKDVVSLLISFNNDSRQYFFSKANENWLNWVWDNGFLDVIKQKSNDPTSYSYRTPELNYLVRMAEKKPTEVTSIILSVTVSEDNFNPEVIDQFLRICGTLPASELARVVPKIREERWVQLMSIFGQWGFDYEKIFQTLATAKDYGSMIFLSEAVLAVKNKEEYKKNYRGYSSGNPFYFYDLSYTKVFEYLVSVDETYLEKVLELTVKIISEVVNLGDEGEKNDVFPLLDITYLFDEDLFSLELGDNKHHSDRENVKDLVATFKVVTRRLIGECCDKPGLVNKIYQSYIKILPESRLTWKMRLYILSLCPASFKDDLRQSFFRLFEVMDLGKQYYEIESGTEYKKALKKSFGFFDPSTQREFISNIFKYFGKSREDKKEEQWHKRDGWQILSSVCDSLVEEEKENCEKLFGRACDSSFEPKPSIGEVVSGFVKPKTVISQDEFANLPISDIAKKLRTDWSPEALRDQNNDKDFLNPLNAEGVGEQLRTDITKRLQDYIQNAGLFFERDILDEHYTYCFFRGIQEAIRSDKSKALICPWDNLINVLINIKDSGLSIPFDHKVRDQERFDSWLSSWTGVLSAIADVLQELLSENEGKTIIDFTKYRAQLFEVIGYLLSFPDPESKDEELETATMKTHSPGDNEEYYVSDPFTMAINTVRGRAFQVFVLFVYQDGKQFNKDDKIKIAEDVKKLYEDVLNKENTRALMFMFGHFMASFYLRDINWMHSLLNQIFSEATEKIHLYLAAWEGYLAGNLYEEIFFDQEFQKLYERGLNLTSIKDHKRKYFREPEKGIATHVALAFIFYHKKFGFEHPLFKKFWERGIEHQKEFINFIGRMFISGDNAKADEQLKDEESRKRLIDFWEWLVVNHNDLDLFIEFGFWINLEKDIFDPVWLAKQVRITLEKTKGDLGWDYALTKSISILANTAPKDTIEIVRLFLLGSGSKSKKTRGLSFIYDKEWSEAIKILYVNIETKDDTYKLINDLIQERGSEFWGLKEILKLQS